MRPLFQVGLVLHPRVLLQCHSSQSTIIERYNHVSRITFFVFESNVAVQRNDRMNEPQAFE